MGWILIWALLLGGTGSPSVLRPAEESSVEKEFTVLSFNIRFNNPNDGINAWPHRRDRVAELIGTRYRADLAGLQEALKDQIEDLELRLPDYGWLGVGREDGEEKGEFTPIFYRGDRFEPLEHGVFWLSETPEVPGSKSWDAAITRIVTWARFRDLLSGVEFYHFNTHFDHRGEKARQESARLLAQRMKKMAGARPVILTGDLNARPDGEVYRLLAAEWKDTRQAARQPPEGPDATFTDWISIGPPGSRIDYVFVSDGVEVLQHRVGVDRFEGRFVSDHLPVITRLKWP